MNLAVPGIVSTETPDVAFEVAATVSAAAVVLVLGVEEDHGACGFGARIVSVGVCNNDVSPLRVRAADFVGEPHQAAVLIIGMNLSRAEHDHGVAEGELRM